jgi:NAD(P)-dependent dehydrogenase (short-subunit alcohol dehydrogenase family)
MTMAPRRKVLITGAAGGMGRACARLFGVTHDLVLSDVSAQSLDRFAGELRDECFTVAAHSGDMGDTGLIRALVGELAGGAAFSVVHTAGLSPTLGDWRAILSVNLVATVRLLDALEPVLAPGSAAVLIASTAGHMMPAMPPIDVVLAEPLVPDFLERMEAIIGQMGGDASPGGSGGIAYSLSKRAVLSLCRSRAASWGARGARITTISPGLIATPMGRAEMAASEAARQLALAPVGRVGAPADIALAAQFLASDAAGFITGTDLLVDGGGLEAMRAAMAGKGAD